MPPQIAAVLKCRHELPRYNNTSMVFRRIIISPWMPRYHNAAMDCRGIIMPPWIAALL